MRHAVEWALVKTGVKERVQRYLHVRRGNRPQGTVLVAARPGARRRNQTGMGLPPQRRGDAEKDAEATKRKPRTTPENAKEAETAGAGASSAPAWGEKRPGLRGRHPSRSGHMNWTTILGQSF
jgi:hypothetical protein